MKKYAVALAFLGGYLGSKIALIMAITLGGGFSMAGALGFAGTGALLGALALPVIGLATYKGYQLVNALFDKYFPGMDAEWRAQMLSNSVLLASLLTLFVSVAALFTSIMTLMTIAPVAIVPVVMTVGAATFLGTLLLSNAALAMYGYAKGMHHAPDSPTASDGAPASTKTSTDSGPAKPYDGKTLNFRNSFSVDSSASCKSWIPSAIFRRNQ